MNRSITQIDRIESSEFNLPDFSDINLSNNTANKIGPVNFCPK